MRLNPKYRQAAGNVCLLVFVALLFSMFTPAGVGTAMAAEESDVTINLGDESQKEIEDAYAKDTAALNIRLIPATTTNFDALQFKLRADDQVSEAVYVSEVGEAAYDDTLGVYVYDLTLDWTVYNVYAQVDFLVYQEAQQLYSVALLREEEPPSGGGTSGGTTPPPAAEPAVTVEPVVSNGVATAKVEVNQVEQAIEQATAGAQVITLEVKAASGAAALNVELPAAVLEKLAAEEFGVLVETSLGAFRLSSDFLAAPEVASALAGGKSLSLAVATGDGAKLAFAPAESRAVGEPIDLELRALAADGSVSKISSFSKPLLLSLSYDPAQLGNVPAAYLGLYRFNEATNSWDYRGGRVDQASHTLTVGLTSFSTYAMMTYSKTFADVAGHWAQADIELMAARHIARGVSDTQFQPNRAINRAEFAALLIRSLGLAEQQPARPTFSDNQTGSWYYGAVETARRAGLVSGYEDNTFRPLQIISREEMATMIVRALEYAGYPAAAADEAALAGYSDASGVSSWAKAAMAQAVQTGIIEGRTPSTLNAKDNATRAESVTMLKRLLAQTEQL